MLLVGGPVIGRSFAAIGRAAEAEDARFADVADSLRRPTLWASVFGLNGMGIGTIWVMVSKPNWTGSIATVAGLAMIGAILGSLRAQRPAAAGN